MQSSVADFFLSGSMFSLMFGMGLTLTSADFRRIANAPRATIAGTLLQLMVLPLIGLMIARLFELPPLLTVGLVVLAACPGGMFSNMFVHIGGGHTALSIALTATSTLVTLFTLPLWVRLSLAGTKAAESLVEMPVLETAVRLGMLTILPIGLGMLMRSQRPDSVYWESRLTRVSIIVICIAVGSDAVNRPEPPSAEFAQSILPVALYSISVLIVGTVIPALLRISSRDAVTIAVELVVKNTLLGIVLLTQTVGFTAIVPSLVYMLVQTPAGVLILVSWRMLVKRGFFEGPPKRSATASTTESGESPALRSSP